VTAEVLTPPSPSNRRLIHQFQQRLMLPCENAEECYSLAMTYEIVDKLTAHIAAGFGKESDVTYVLIQLGKLIERYRSQVSYPVLTFYRNWAVHEKISRVRANPAMGDILDTFETILQGAATSGANVVRSAQNMSDSVSLSRLEQEINQVLRDFNFDVQQVGRSEQWPSFRDLILRILSDITLQADQSYQFIRELRIDGSNGRFDTLVIIDTSGGNLNVPLKF
jgi:hypothetical protein